MLFLQYLCLKIPGMAQILTKESCMACRGKPFNVELLGPYLGHVSVILGPCLVISTICWLLNDKNGSKYHQRGMHAKLKNTP